MTTVPGLFAIGEANFSDHGANRLGASALMQGLADGYFVLPATIGNYLARTKFERIDPSHPACAQVEAEVQARYRRLLQAGRKRTATSFHRELGTMMLDRCGMARNKAGLESLLAEIPRLKERFWAEVNVPGESKDLNQALEVAGRVADFFELAELMCLDALDREESCGGHFREEHQTDEGEARRDDERFSHVTVWESAGEGNRPQRHIEPLSFESVPMAQRSYK
jgi:succinate dehydrogenase / fumarate reductase flavoprotein subunit